MTTINTRDSISSTEIAKDMREIFDSINGSTEQERINQAFEELLAGTKTQNETLDEILEKINTMSEKDAQRERIQEGALCLTGGMIFGAIGLHAATGGKFDILKPTSKLAKFLETRTGKILATLTGAGGILSAMFGIKNLVNEVNDQNK